MSNRAKSKRVAIITLQGKINYGNRLQNYAVARLYEREGFEAITLLRSDAPSLKRRALSFLRGMGSSRNITLRQPQSDADRVAAFERFNSALKFLSVSESDSQLADLFDFFSVGSDQVWNLGNMSDNDSWYYLRFAHPEQRIALAPSIGVSQLNSMQKKRLAKGVSGFRHLSIREQQGAALIKECSGLDAEVICDPTLALSAGEWGQIADTNLTPREPYVFTYLLGERSVATEQVLRMATRDGAIPIVPLSDKSRDGEPAAGPAEFISLIEHASHVVTDSFHAAVFSSLFQTPLTIVRREGGIGMFSRLETLCEMLGIGHKIFGSNEFDMSRSGDYEGVSEAIERERMKFLRYLGTCLNA